MRIVKGLLKDFNALHASLGKFFNSLNPGNIGLRVIAAEIVLKPGAPGRIAYYDSARPDMINGGDKRPVPAGTEERDKLARYFGLTPGKTVMETYTEPEPDEKGSTQRFILSIEFGEKVKTFIATFSTLFLEEAFKYFKTKSGRSMNEIIESKKDILNKAIKRHIDLDIVNMLAARQYERRENRGSLLYVEDKNEATYSVKFNHKIDLTIENLRLLRRLLEMSDSSLSLVVSNRQVIGLGTKERAVNKVQFTGHQNWQLTLTNKESLRCKKGRYYIDDGYTEVFSALPENFIADKYEKTFNDITNALSKQKHGALLIISDNARDEVARLAKFERGYSVAPIDFKRPANMRLIRSLSNVDGALFIDQSLVCHGAGLILDGVAKRPGSNARGARYNSARCYLDNMTEGGFAAVVFSEDDTIDVLLNDRANEKTKLHQFEISYDAEFVV